MWKLVTIVSCTIGALVIGGYVKKSLEASKPQRERNNEIKANESPVRQTT